MQAKQDTCSVIHGLLTGRSALGHKKLKMDPAEVDGLPRSAVKSLTMPTAVAATAAVVVAAAQAYKKLITDPAEVDGLPPTALGLAAQQARSEGHESASAEKGPWLLTLDFPSYYPVMTHCKNRCGWGCAIVERAFHTPGHCCVNAGFLPRVPLCQQRLLSQLGVYRIG